MVWCRYQFVVLYFGRALKYWFRPNYSPSRLNEAADPETNIWPELSEPIILYAESVMSVH
jgi:hypothetical protein